MKMIPEEDERPRSKQDSNDVSQHTIKTNLIKIKKIIEPLENKPISVSYERVKYFWFE